jgi:hypothetical protein
MAEPAADLNTDSALNKRRTNVWNRSACVRGELLLAVVPVDAADAVDVVAGCAIEEGCARKKLIAHTAMLRETWSPLYVMTTP